MVIKRIRKSDLTVLAKEAAALKTCSVLDSTGYYSILTVTSADGTVADVAIDVFKVQDGYRKYFGIYLSANDDMPIIELNNKTLEDIQPSGLVDDTTSLDIIELKHVIRQIMKSFIEAIKKEVIVVK